MRKMILICLLILFVTGCSSEPEILDRSEGTIEGISYKQTDEVTNYIQIVMENNDVILIELYPEYAPITVENFQDLVSREFYDGTMFHRVMEGFMIQGGQSATNEPTDTIIGEFANNGINNPIRHERGVISMARTMVSMDSASSQFFIMHEIAPSLDDDYAAFGRVIAGMDAVDRIATTAVDASNPSAPIPIRPQVVRTIRFVTIER